MEQIIILVLTIITAGPRPDDVRRMEEPSIAKCWEDAAAFFAQGIPKRERDNGAEGLKAECRANAAAVNALRTDPPT